MAEVAERMSTEGEQPQAEENLIVFGGERRNMAMGIAMLGAGIAAFVSGLTDTFFAQAIAWTFLLWGIFFLYGDLLLSTRRYELRDDTLTVLIPFRFWNRKRVWEWQNVNRMDILVRRRDIRQDSATLQIYHQFPGEISLDREDRNYDPELAWLVIQRAKLKADATSSAVDLDDLPLGTDLVLTWKK